MGAEKGRIARSTPDSNPRNLVKSAAPCEIDFSKIKLPSYNTPLDEDVSSVSSFTSIDEEALEYLCAEKRRAQIAEDQRKDHEMTGIRDNHESLCSHPKLPGPLHTCTHPYHSPYSESNLPALLFRLDPPVQMNQEVVPDLLLDGEPVKNAAGVSLRDFKFLPRYISVQVPGWLLEYWCRSDPRLTYKDIRSRMVGDLDKLPTENTLNMRREREARAPLGLSCWTNGRTQISRTELRRIEGWTVDQISLNTTMNVGYQLSATALHRWQITHLIPKGLKEMENDGGPCYYPVDIFLESHDRRHTPSNRIATAIVFFFKLVERARKEELKSWEEAYAKDAAASKHVQGTSKKRPSNGREGSKRVRRKRKASESSDE